MSTVSTASGSLAEYGLISGLNTQSIIAAELQSYQQPITNLESEQSSLSSNVSDYQQINSDLTALKTAADTLATSDGWNAMAATASDSTVASATAANGTPAGSVQFSVLQLAASNSMVSSGSASSTSQVVTTNSDFLVSQGGAELGFSTLAAGTDLSLGAHDVKVTQASQAAEQVGSVPTAATTIQTGVNDSLAVSVNGQAYTLQIAASPSGGYTASGLAGALQTAIQNAGAGGSLQAGLDSSGHLMLSTVNQGSSQTLSVTGGDAASALGFQTGTSSSGVDGVVTVDGVSNTLTDIAAGATTVLNAANGSTITSTIVQPSSGTSDGTSLISTGSLTATNVSTGNGSLSAVVAGINAAGTGVTASAVQTSASKYVLQLSSSATGSASDLSVDTSAFSGSSLGSLKTASAGQDAQIQVGGAGGYVVSSENNTFTGLLPGLSVTAEKVSTTPVTVSVAADASTVATSVKTMVDDANTVLSDIQNYAGYNASTKTGGPLMGSATLQNLTNEIQGIFASAVGTSDLGSSVGAGISLSKGTLSFDQTAFEKAFNANPNEVESLFTRGGTFTASSAANAGQVSLNYASNTTKSGSYTVGISQSASQASTSGAVLSGGAVSSAETLNLSMGGSTMSYITSAGESLASISQGINSGLASAGMDMSAEIVNGNQLQLVSDGYGSSSSFSVSTTGGSGTLGLTNGTFSGTDVAGTINGVAATGSGQFLSAPTSDPVLGGLTLQVTATGVSQQTALGTFNYTPGLAQAISNLSYSMSDPSTGEITHTISGLQNQSTSLTPQISFYNSILLQQQKLLTNQYAAMESTLGTLKNQSSSLTAQLANLP